MVSFVLLDLISLRFMSPNFTYIAVLVFHRWLLLLLSLNFLLLINLPSTNMKVPNLFTSPILTLQTSHGLIASEPFSSAALKIGNFR